MARGCKQHTRDMTQQVSFGIYFVYLIDYYHIMILHCGRLLTRSITTGPPRGTDRTGCMLLVPVLRPWEVIIIVIVKRCSGINPIPPTVKDRD